MSENEEIADLKRQLAMVTDELNQVKSQQYQANEQRKEEDTSPRERAYATYSEQIRKGTPPDQAKAAFVHDLLHGEGQRRRAEEEDAFMGHVRESVDRAREEGEDAE